MTPTAKVLTWDIPILCALAFTTDHPIMGMFIYVAGVTIGLWCARDDI